MSCPTYPDLTWYHLQAHELCRLAIPPWSAGCSRISGPAPRHPVTSLPSLLPPLLETPHFPSSCKTEISKNFFCKKQLKITFLHIVFFGGPRVSCPLLCLYRPIFSFKRCLDSNPESYRSKQTCYRYQLSHPSPSNLANNLPKSPSNSASKHLETKKIKRVFECYALQGIGNQEGWQVQERWSSFVMLYSMIRFFYHSRSG